MKQCKCCYEEFEPKQENPYHEEDLCSPECEENFWTNYPEDWD